MDKFPLKNWIPYKLVNLQGQIYCRWLNAFNKTFTEPFFDETILKLRGLNSAHSAISSVSDLSMLEEWVGGLNSVEPTAFIFHISRCGSTLVSQLLATSDQHIVLPEVPFFDDLLRLPYQHTGFSPKDASSLLMTAVKYYGQKRTGREQHLIIKADSWHMFFYEQLRPLYPTAPFILMYRDPNEVFSSLKRIPGLQSVPGLIEPEVLGFAAEEEVPQALDIYIAKLLEKYLQQYLKIITTDNHFLLLNYSERAIPMIKKIADFAHITLSRQDLVDMDERSRYHSKKPGETFSEISPAATPLCLRKAMELYKELEERRKAILV
ncbi:Sulfotransferase family protein [Mucilaginibacter sp. OK268]|uniref:sulfotransferase n=1 Tax=Mucilaginibacter sp. OK268 TaxID=1881048 RepID=UPI00088625BC|nr:sulfotransferase [Mucilaginibacter sp. OK268]SDP30178.1 Sulfotransferase family protein [Mucilaginibacter sp. OK268]